jgi:hypothetical protein
MGSGGSCSFFSVAQPFTAGWPATEHRSPIHRASLSLELKHYWKPDESGFFYSTSDPQP